MKSAVLVASVVILLALDAIYLTSTSRFANDMIVSVQKFSPKLRPLSALACYIILFAGLWFFILRKHRPPTEAALLGWLIYGVYETTNYAILKNWRPKMVIMDTLWGGVLLGLTTWLTYKTERMF